MDVDKIVVILVIAAFFLGPQRLVTYSRQLAVFVRRVRGWADATKAEIEQQTGVDVDWSDLDPRRYDPRRIIREALSEPLDVRPAAATAEPPTPGVRHVADGTPGR
ncbi:Sec-independent protein translocase TatB [Curtobacterium sp. 'Ferrero']|uniref:Sec-independent protein translocase TatB n=1 Tax=Curtobacterium sp. 'Ferrero' TaxID=2033654 RepID=UPI000BCFD2BB|nr:Sec-independent protein translocase TatB [Curtobacterium sp. 'Ferrero']PCN48673.1 Sec-independent protein translocase TatB [Curtobacterium sp. 'Ferrero']